MIGLSAGGFHVVSPIFPLTQWPVLPLDRVEVRSRKEAATATQARKGSFRDNSAPVPRTFGANVEGPGTWSLHDPLKVDP